MVVGSGQVGSQKMNTWKSLQAYLNVFTRIFVLFYLYFPQKIINAIARIIRMNFSPEQQRQALLLAKVQKALKPVIVISRKLMCNALFFPGAANCNINPSCLWSILPLRKTVEST